MNHVVTATEDLRAAQLADTRERIARATVEVISREGAAALSFPSVAEQAGVSLRTVYRHFPNKDALVLAAVQSGASLTQQIFPRPAASVTQMRDLLPILWEKLEQQRDLVAVQHASPAGVEIRGVRLRERRDQVIESLARDYPEIPAEDLRPLAELITVMIGSTLLFDLVDHLGLEVTHAAGLAAYAIEAVTDRARREGGIR